MSLRYFYRSFRVCNINLLFIDTATAGQPKTVVQLRGTLRRLFIKEPDRTAQFHVRMIILIQYNENKLGNDFAQALSRWISNKDRSLPTGKHYVGYGLSYSTRPKAI